MSSPLLESEARPLEPAPRSVVAAFDFDHTMTTADSFVAFLFRAFGRPRTALALAELLPEAVRYFLGASSRDALKERLVKRLFSGVSAECLRRVGQDHAGALAAQLRPAALKRIAWHKARGDRLILVSASLDVYLAPLARSLGFDDLLCTRLSIVAERCDGRLSGNNCRGTEKVKRLTELLGELSAFELYAYGDSDGDAAMLAVADHAYFRAFESTGALADPAPSGRPENSAGRPVP
jgi:HAD superfamily hydrolase (TIGR01490 family)